jgi:hypothetical protein
MATTIDVSAYEPILREKYGDLYEAVYPTRPFLGLVPKETNFYGKRYVFPVQYNNTLGASSNFVSASLNSGAPAEVDFVVTRKSEYGTAEIARELMLASMKDGAAEPAFENSMKRTIAAVSDRVAYKIMRGATIGRVGSSTTLASTTLALSSVADAANVFVGDILNLATAATGGSLRGGGASVTVTAVNRAAGTATLSANLSTISGAAIGDYIVKAGDYGNSMVGVGDWIPREAPTSGDSFFDVDRSIDVVRLAGHRLDGTAMGLEEGIVNLAAEIDSAGGRPDLVLMNPRKVAAFKNSLSGQVQYQTVKGADPRVSFRGIVIAGPAGDMVVLGDRTVPDTDVFVLEKSTWVLKSLDHNIPEVFDEDFKLLRVNQKDAYEIRVGGYGNVVCHEPSHNGRLLTPATSY